MMDDYWVPGPSPKLLAAWKRIDELEEENEKLRKDNADLLGKWVSAVDRSNVRRALCLTLATLTMIVNEPTRCR